MPSFQGGSFQSHFYFTMNPMEAYLSPDTFLPLTSQPIPMNPGLTSPLFTCFWNSGQGQVLPAHTLPSSPVLWQALAREDISTFFLLDVDSWPPGLTLALYFLSCWLLFLFLILLRLIPTPPFPGWNSRSWGSNSTSFRPLYWLLLAFLPAAAAVRSIPWNSLPCTPAFSLRWPPPPSGLPALSFFLSLHIIIKLFYFCGLTPGPQTDLSTPATLPL